MSMSYIIEVVGTCNLRCPTCPNMNFRADEFIGETRPIGIMDKDLFVKVVDKIRAEVGDSPTQLLFYNWGEPFLHPKLDELVKYAKQKDFYVMLSTNLNILTNIGKVIKQDPNFLRISISGSSQEAYGITHKKGNINLVKSNLYKLRYFMDKYKSKTDIQIYYHMYKSNLGQEFEEMIRLAQDLGFSLTLGIAVFQNIEKSIAYLKGTPPPH